MTYSELYRIESKLLHDIEAEKKFHGASCSKSWNLMSWPNSSITSDPLAPP
jgi:hypothetical protein